MSGRCWRCNSPITNANPPLADGTCGRCNSEDVKTEANLDAITFSLMEICAILETWTPQEEWPKSDDERIVQRTCRRLTKTFQDLAKQKRNHE